MEAILTVGTESMDRAGSMSLQAFDAYGSFMEVRWQSELSLVLELTVGGALGPWYSARNIPTVSGSLAMEARILLAAKHFQLHAGELALKPRNGKEWWDMFRRIWDYLEVEAPLA